MIHIYAYHDKFKDDHIVFLGSYPETANIREEILRQKLEQFFVKDPPMLYMKDTITDDVWEIKLKRRCGKFTINFVLERRLKA